MALDECILYTTTFPCHDCAKHIVASGIREVVYLAPYPKSLVAEPYDDSIEVNVPKPDSAKVQFHSFVGIAPSRYQDLFTLGKRRRKDGRGKAIRFDPARARLTLPDYAPAPQTVKIAEQTVLGPFTKKFTQLLAKYRRESRLRSRRRA